ncbi:MAG TPA: ABC transporter substrate binding protein [Stellaceae bacterium]|nr:ABC transporter substrate binding protein [Stellaceae bacterium]
MRQFGNAVLVPQARAIGVLVNPTTTNAEPMIGDAQEAAHTIGVRLDILKLGVESEIDTTFATLAHLQTGALVVAPGPFFFQRRRQVIDRASRDAIPTIYSVREFAAEGGLISYGADLKAAYRQLGIYTGQTLKGAKPADLPIEQPTKFDLMINLKNSESAQPGSPTFDPGARR